MLQKESVIDFWWLPVLFGILSWVLTAALRRYASARSLLDIPNERSSHSEPTPRGGGVAIVLAFFTGVIVLTFQQWLPTNIAAGLVGAGALVALIGFLDDHNHIAARWRLLTHFIASSWGLYWLGGAPSVEILGFTLGLVWLEHILAVLYLVWLLNLYNFMDGINGIASIEALTTCLGGGVAYWLAAPAESAAYTLLLWLLAAIMAGFLPWNFPQAKIFLGDVGSGFLGLILGLLSLQAAWLAPQLLWCWLILLGVFVVDATLTLLRRMKNGEKIYEAHRSHAYQNASHKLRSHKPVSLAVGAINVLWLLPIAAVVAVGWMDGFLGLLVAYTPLVYLVVHLKAGKRSEHSTS